MNFTDNYFTKRRFSHAAAWPEKLARLRFECRECSRKFNLRRRKRAKRQQNVALKDMATKVVRHAALPEGTPRAGPTNHFPEQPGTRALSVRLLYL